MHLKNVISTALFCSLTAVCSCTNSSEKKEAEPVYPVSTALVKDTTITKDYIAQVQSLKNIEIRAKEPGFLQKVLVDEGQYVHAGQVLFQIMPQLLQAETMKAKAEVEQASIELSNATTLAKNNVVSKNEQAMAKAKLDAAKASLRLSQIHLGFTAVRAPFSGIINRIPKKIGSMVEEGELLTSLSDNSGVYAYFNVSEPEYLNYQMHAGEEHNPTLGFQMANGTLLPDKGYIQNIEGEFDNETGNIAFRAKFPNHNQILRNGETGKVLMQVPLSGALLIPQSATYEIQDQKYVFTVGKDGRAHSRNIKIAYELPDVYIVSGGITAADRFLVEGADKVKDGDLVKVKYEAPQVMMRSLKLQAN